MLFTHSRDAEDSGNKTSDTDTNNDSIFTSQNVQYLLTQQSCDHMEFVTHNHKDIHDLYLLHKKVKKTL